MSVYRFKSLRVFFQITCLLLDVINVCAIYFLLLFLRYDASYVSHVNTYALAIMIASTLFFVYVVGGYETSTDKKDFRFLAEYIISGVVNLLVAQFLIYFITDTPAARAVVGSTLLIFPLVSLSYRNMFYSKSQKALSAQKLFVVGAGKTAQALYKQLLKEKWVQEIYFFDPTSRRQGEHLIPMDKDSPIVKGKLLEAIEKNSKSINCVLLATEPKEVPTVLIEWLISRHYVDVTVKTINNFYTTYWKTVPLNSLSPYWAFEDGFLLNHSPSFTHTKRLFDAFFATATLILLSPIIVILSIIIKLDSPGPILFRQTRIGLKQKPFTMYKFRSMHVHEPSSDKDRYTSKADSRITSAGRFMRKSRLDELPQLINVIKGEMSLIGPRAEWDQLVNNYQREIPYYHFRHLVKPGISGWAQVNYPYGESGLDAIEKLKYDLYYVRYFSFKLDLSICLKTLYVILFGKGQ